MGSVGNGKYQCQYSNTKDESRQEYSQVVSTHGYAVGAVKSLLCHKNRKVDPEGYQDKETDSKQIDRFLYQVIGELIRNGELRIVSHDDRPSTEAMGDIDRKAIKQYVPDDWQACDNGISDADWIFEKAHW